MKRVGFLLLLLISLAMFSSFASATQFTIYCTGSSSTCSTSAPGSGDYWKFVNDVTTSGNTFDFKMNITFNGSGSAGYLTDFSAQLFFGGSQLTSLAWVLNPGNWQDLEASKAGNSGTCSGSTPGAVCGSIDDPNQAGPQVLGTPVFLGNVGGATLEVSGQWDGTLYDTDNGETFWHLQAAASKNSDSTGGNVFGVSTDVVVPPPPPTPEPACLLLLGSGIGSLALFFRRRR